MEHIILLIYGNNHASSNNWYWNTTWNHSYRANYIMIWKLHTLVLLGKEKEKCFLFMEHLLLQFLKNMLHDAICAASRYTMTKLKWRPARYTTPDECSFHIKNTGKETVTFGASQFPLYFSFCDDWFPVMRIRSIGFGGTEIQLSTGKEYNLRIPFTQIYRRLTKGSYRILLRTTKGKMVYVAFEL